MLRDTLKIVHHISTKGIPQEIKYRMETKEFLEDLAKWSDLEIRPQEEQGSHLLIC